MSPWAAVVFLQSPGRGKRLSSTDRLHFILQIVLLGYFHFWGKYFGVRSLWAFWGSWQPSSKYNIQQESERRGGWFPSLECRDGGSWVGEIQWGLGWYINSQFLAYYFHRESSSERERNSSRDRRESRPLLSLILHSFHPLSRSLTFSRLSSSFCLMMSESAVLFVHLFLLSIQTTSLIS